MSKDPVGEILEAKTNEQQFNKLVEDHKRFILASAYKAAGRYISESDDEYSVSLIAFHEAVQSFSEEKGDFHAFAALVIRRRIYDYQRSQSRFAPELPVEPTAMSGDTDEDSPSLSLHLAVQKKEAELSAADTATRPDVNPIRDEIEAVQEILGRYGFSFFDLTECSPKAQKTKHACAEVVAFMLTREDLIEKMRSTKNLPAKEIKENTKTSRKILERHRKYIIAAIEILNGEYPLLAEYMDYIRKTMVT